MKVADIVWIDKSGSMLVPNRLREFVGGFEVGTEIWFHPVESIFYQPSPDPQDKEPVQISEPKLFISVINPQCWPYLYDIDISLGDTRGALAEVLRILAECNISVIMGEARTTLYRVRAEANLILDFEKFSGTIEDLNSVFEEEVRKDPKLRKYLKPIEREVDREIWVRGRPSSLQDLVIDGKEFAPGAAMKPGRDEVVKVPTRSKYSFVKAENRINIPKGLLEKFTKRMRRPLVETWAIMTAHSDTKMLQLTFPRSDAELLQIGFLTRNGAEAGSLLNLCDYIVSKNFNIYECRNRILEFAHGGLWIVIADIKDSDYRNIASEQELEQKLKADIENQKVDLGLVDKSTPFSGFNLYSPRERKKRKKDFTGLSRLIFSFERQIRVQIERYLSEFYSQYWWRRGVPPDVRENAESRIQKERPEAYSPIDFVEFSAYEKIICRKDNWESIFKRMFHTKAWVQTKLSELLDIRNRFYHSRVTTKKDLRKFRETSKDVLGKFERNAS